MQKMLERAAATSATADRLPRHMPGLDGLRGIAILLVILTHTADGWRRALMVVQDADWMAPLSLPSWLAAIANSASMGVELFFVISAFTLTVSLTRKPLPLGAYALRRIARVAPGYWLAGVGYTLVAGLGVRLLAPHGTGIGDLLSAAFFLSTSTGGASLAVVPGGWSVSCEMAFYVALPAILWLVRRSLRRALMLAAILSLAAQVFARAFVLRDGFNQAAYFNPIEHAPVFAYGVAASLLAMSAKLRFPSWLGLVPLTAAIVILPVVPISMGKLMPQLPFAALCAASVVLVAIQPPTVLANRLIKKIGEISYSMYLVHWAILPVSLYVTEMVFPSDNYVTFATHFFITVIGAFILSCFSYRYIERPFIDWAHRQTRK